MVKSKYVACLDPRPCYANLSLVHAYGNKTTTAANAQQATANAQQAAANAIAEPHSTKTANAQERDTSLLGLRAPTAHHHHPPTSHRPKRSTVHAINCVSRIRHQILVMYVCPVRVSV